MASKQLSIAITAQDTASPVVRAAAANIIRAAQQTAAQAAALARPVLAVAQGVEGVASRAIRAVFNLKTAIVGALASAGAYAAGGALIGSARETNEMAEQARQLGVNIEQFSVYRYAARMANVDVSELYSAVRKGTENLGDFVASGANPASDALRRLGISAVDARGRARAITDVIAEMGAVLKNAAPAERLAAFTDVFGRSGQSIERLTAGGGLARAREELQKLGGVVTDRHLAAAKAWDDSLNRVAVAWASVKREAMAALAGPVSNLLDSIAYRLAKIPDQVRALTSVMGTWMGGGPGAKQAGQLLGDVWNATWGVAKTGAIEAGRVLGVAALEAISIGATKLGPVLGDVLKDVLHFAIGDSLQVAGIGPNFKASAGTALDEVVNARASLVEIVRLQDELDAKLKARWVHVATSAEEAQYNILAMKKRAILSTLKEAGLDPDSSNAVFEKEIADKRAILDRLKDERSRDFARAFDIGLKATAAAAETASQNWRKAIGELDSATSTLEDFWRASLPPEPVRAAQQETSAWWLKLVALVNRTEDAAGAAWTKLRGMWAEAGKLARGAAGMQGDLAVRALAAVGATEDADRLRLQITQRRELAETVEKYGRVFPELVGNLREVQGLEAQRYELGVRQRAILAELTAAQERYSAEAQRYGDEGQAGLMNPGLVAANQQGALDRYRATVQAARDQLAGLSDDFPNLSAAAAEPLAQIDHELTGINTQLERMRLLAPPVTFMDGVRSALTALRAQAADVAGFATQLVGNTVEQFSGGLANALIESVSNVRNLGTAMREFAANTLRMVAQMVTQFLILKAVMGLVGAIGGGAGGPSAELFASGGQSLEGSLLGVGGNFKSASRAAPVLALGGAAKAIGGGGGMVFSPTINITMTGGGGGGTAAADAYKAAKAGAFDGWMEAVQRRPDARERAREVMKA